MEILVRQNQSSELASEADHRIANSLMLVSSLLRLQAKELAKQPVVTGAHAHSALHDAAARIDAVGHLHRMLCATPDSVTVDSTQYLRRVVDATNRLVSRTGSVTEVFYDCTEYLQLDPRRMTAIGLLTSEAVINSMKHAHPTGIPGEIRVSLRQIGSECVLAIEDDGVGLPEGFNTATDGSLGFRTMRQLSSQLDARLTYQSTPLGLRTEVLFKL